MTRSQIKEVQPPQHQEAKTSHGRKSSIHTDREQNARRKPGQNRSNRPKPQALKQDHYKDSSSVSKRSELAFCTTDPCVIRNGNFDGAKAACDGLAGELGLRSRSQLSEAEQLRETDD